jgi:membrane-associated PAP2 superfamily phosphatase
MTYGSLLTATPAQFWVRHAWPVLLLFTGTACVFAISQLDVVIAQALFFDPLAHGWIGADSWLVNEFIHTGGGWAVRVVGLAAVAVWISSFVSAPMRAWRRPAGYFASAVLLTVGVVGLLKTVTNVDCPWDLSAFGGRLPYVDLFSSRPDGLPRARCFPAAHAGSGYALTALYFLARERSRLLSRVGLGIGLLLGLAFGVAQQSRGAHFLSHDLWSAFFGWMIPLTLYTFAFGGHLYGGSGSTASLLSQRSQAASR